MSTLLDIQTPALVLDRAKLSKNISRMAKRASELGVPLRPHLKTPKSIHIAEALQAAGAVGFNVSTLMEAEYFFRNGINNLYYCVPFAPAKTKRALELVSAGCQLILMVDSVEGAEKCVRAAEDLNSAAVLDFTIEIDVDGYRTGLRENADDLVKIASILTDSEATRFVGIMSYAGASYGKTPEEARSFAAEHVDALKNSKGILEKEGYACDFVSIGSTPAVLHADNLEGVTEARCGIYAFQDLFQAGIGAATVDDIAVSVVADVIARQPHYNRFVIDAGGLALSKDRSTAGKPFDAQYGLVCDAETGSPLGDLAVVSVSQEIGLVSSLSGASVDLDAFPIGRRIRILPNHADMTAAAYEQYHVVEGDANIIDVWTRQNHWT